MAYDSPGQSIRREIQVANLAGVASASLAKFLMFQKTRLKAVHALIVTAGTNAAAGLDIYVGTASVGTILCSSDTAGTVEHSGVINVDVPQNGLIEIKGKANSATLVVSLAIEHQVESDATVS